MVAIISGVDAENNVRMEVEIQGLYKSVPYGAVVDTGFTGGLVLPIFIAVDIGLEKVGASTIILADGSMRTLPTFLCKIKIGSKISDVITIILGSEILIGMEALKDHRICISPGTGQVIVESAASTDDYRRLSESLQRLVGV